MSRVSVLTATLVLISACTSKPGNLLFDDLRLRPENTEIESRIQMGDRYYVRSVLADVFDLTETEASTIGAKFSTPFGGACDYYMRGESEGATPAFQVQDRGCSYYPKQTVLPVSAPDRSAILAVACDDLLNDYKYFQRAIRKIHPAWPALDGQFSAKPEYAPTPETVSKLYQFFYPLDEPAPAVIDALLAVGKKSTDLRASWRYIMTTVCYSPDWQTP